MDTTTPSASDTAAGTQFTVDLSQIELTQEEVNALHNAITKLAVETVQQRASAAAARRIAGEPYVKITFVKAVPPSATLRE